MTIPDDFYIGIYPVTQEEWQKVMGSNPSHFQKGGKGADKLTGISDATNGIYIHLENQEDATITLTQRLDSIEKRALTDSEFINYKNYFSWFIGLAGILLILELFIPERKRKIA